MNLDDLKSDWSVYSDQLSKSNDLESKTIETILRKKSISVVADIKKSYVYGALLLSVFFMSFLVLDVFQLKAIVLHRRPLELTADLLFMLLICCGIIALLKAYLRIQKINFYPYALSAYIEEVIIAYLRLIQVMQWVGTGVLISVAILIPLSTLESDIARFGWLRGLFNASSLLLFLLGFNFVQKNVRYFKKKEWYQPEQIMTRLNELKTLSEELKA